VKGSSWSEKHIEKAHMGIEDRLSHDMTHSLEYPLSMTTEFAKGGDLPTLIAPGLTFLRLWWRFKIYSPVISCEWG
jgi:hypothetical protein